MVDVILFTTSLISAIISYASALIFLRSYLKEKKSNRMVYCIAFLLYALGHTIQAVIAVIIIDISSSSYVLWMWIYVNLGGAGTTGLVLYSTVPFVTEKKNMREILTGLFMGLYIIGSLLFAFVLPPENPLTILLLNKTGSQLGNMSWWVVQLLILFSFFISIVFVRHFKVSGTVWGLLIGLSFLIYAIILFIWPIQDLKPIFYIFRCISVGLLSIGGVLLARD